MPQDYRITRLRGQWALSVWNDGQRTRRVTLGTADRKEAERQADRLITEWSKPEHITVAYVWQRYRDENKDKRASANMAFSGKSILPEFGHLLPDEVNKDLCERYAKKRLRTKWHGKNIKPGTVWTEMNHLQIVLNWATKHRIIPYAVYVTRPPKPAPKDRRLTGEESKRLLDASPMLHIQTAIAIMLYTGARSGAVLDLTWDRVHFDRGIIELGVPDDGGRRKGRATVPMNADLVQRLKKAKNEAMSDYVVEWAGRRLGSLKRGFARAVELAGLENVSPHVLRHTAASRMAAAGVPMTQIAAVLGHSDSRTSERIYAKFSPTHLRGAVDSLDLSDESGVPSGSREPKNANGT